MTCRAAAVARLSGGAAFASLPCRSGPSPLTAAPLTGPTRPAAPQRIMTAIRRRVERPP